MCGLLLGLTVHFHYHLSFPGVLSLESSEAERGFYALTGAFIHSLGRVLVVGNASRCHSRERRCTFPGDYHWAHWE